MSTERFEKGQRVYHTARGIEVQSYFHHYCEDQSKAVVDDGDGWNAGYEVVKVSELRQLANGEL